MDVVRFLGVGLEEGGGKLQAEGTGQASKVPSNLGRNLDNALSHLEGSTHVIHM